MPVSFRTPLPRVPSDSWQATHRTNPEDPDTGQTLVVVRLHAPTDIDAELRALAYLDVVYEDDLRRAIAVAQSQIRPGMWTVHVTVTDPWR